MNTYLLPPLLRAGLLLFWSVVSMLSCWEYYLAGHYELVLLMLAVIPAWLLHALLLVVRQNYRRDPVISSVCILLLALPAWWQWTMAAEPGMTAMYALPVLMVLLLPEALMFKAMMVVTIISAIVCGLDHSLREVLEMMLSFILMVILISVGTLYWQREQAYRQLRFLRDPASGACNAQFLDEFLQREIARCQITDGRVSLVGLVIDEYEQLRKAHSSRELQALYRGIVTIIRGRIRRVDEVFRLQGGLWIVILPDCREDAEIVLREALTRQLEESDWQEIQQLSLTSSGVTLAAGEDTEELLKRLQSRLNKQKQGHVQAAAFRL